MKKSKKLLSWSALGVLLLSNVFSPWTYAEGETEGNSIDVQNGEQTEIQTDEQIEIQTDEQVVTIEENITEIIAENGIIKENETPEINNIQELETNGESTHDYLERCYDYEYNSYGTLILNRYVCDDTNIMIPTSESGANKTTSIQDGAFAGKIIESLEMPDQFSVNYEAFSGAIFSGKITLEEKKSGQYFNTLYSITVAEGATLTLKQANRLYMSTVNGKLIYDLNNLSSANYLLNKGTINGEVEIRGLNGSLNRSFESCNITENGKVLLGEGITKIDESSFGGDSYTDTPSILRGTLVFPSTLKEISSSFHNTQINSNLIFPKSINKVYYSFRESDINSDFFFESESEESGFNIDSSFGYSNIGSLVFSGLNITLNNVSPQNISGNLSFINSKFNSFSNFLTIGNHIISGDVNFINTDLNLNGGQFFRTSTIVGNFNMSGENIKLSSGIPVALKIGGNLNITGNNLIMPGFANSEITGNVNINANTMNLQYGLNYSKIKGNVSIIGDDIFAKYGALNNLSISGNFLMSGNNLDLATDVLNNLGIDGNFEIQGGLLKAYYGVLNNLNVYGDIRLPKNSEFGAGTLGGVIAKGNYIIGYETTVSIGDSVNNAQLSNDVKIVADEIESSEINTTDDKIVIQNSEIIATSGMVAEYEGGLKVNFQDNSSTDIEGTARFSAPIAIKVPVKNMTNNYVKVMVKHQGDEDFGFTGLTLNKENTCSDGLPTADQYNGEDVAIEENNGERYAVIYTCSASTFIAYSENEITNNNQNNESNNSNNENNTQNDEIQSSTKSYSGGGRKITKAEKQHNAAEENEKSDTLISKETPDVNKIDTKETKKYTVKNTVISNNPKYTKEENKAYSFAKSNGITSASSIETAKMNTDVTRIQMAKMLSNFAINILGKEPDVSKGIIEFYDVTSNMDKQYDNAVTKAYQLGIMGQNVKNNKFRPNDKITRAEFSAVLSRLLYNTDEGKYKGTSKYYQPHITKLYNEGIISNADPKLKEKRGYVMTILMRSVK